MRSPGVRSLPRTLELTDQERARAVGWPTTRRALGYFRPYLPQVGAGLLLIGAVSVLGLVPALMMKEIFDAALPARNAQLLLVFAAIWVGSQAVAALLGMMQQVLADRIAHALMYDIRTQLYDRLQRQSLRFFSQTRAGEIISRMSNDVATVQQTVRYSTVTILTALMTALTTIALMVALHPGMALAALVAVPLFVFPTRRVGQAQQRLTRLVASRLGKLESQMQETLSISGAVLIKSFGRQEYEVDRFRQESAAVRDLSIQQYAVARWLNALLGFLSALGPAILLVIGGALFIRGQVSLGTIVAFGGLLSRLYAPAGTLANTHVQIMGALALFDRLFEYLDLPTEIGERPDAVDLKAMRGDVQFRNVSFRYGTGPWILKGISFEARPGQLVALVGPSGAGKTTITYLIPRFYDATEGAVEIDGYDVRTLSFRTLQQAMGIVSQEPALFHGTIRENLRYANLAASDHEIEEACRAAYIHDVIERLPKQYDTMVGERGFHLSGGEKQRLAIARVLLRDPAILILDEATSHLDYESEAKVQAALEKVSAGRTVLVIAHRLSTILRADRILVVDGGRIVEHGRHEELLVLGGVYTRLYKEQFKT